MDETTTRPARPDFKKVTKGGVMWEVISRNERQTTHAGRHFFACRCNSETLWRIDEMTKNATGGKIIGPVATCITAGLSSMVIAATTTVDAL